MAFGQINREAIFSALFAILQAQPGFQVISRIPRLPTELDASQLPAMFLEQGDSVLMVQQSPGVPAIGKWELDADISIYVQGAGVEEVIGQETYIPATALNTAMDQIIAAVAPKLGVGKQTLAGLVKWCEVEGKVIQGNAVPGKGTQLSVAVIPIKIRAI
jgi:hypothetical protein